MMEPIVFMFCLTLHNAEEALWMTDWRMKTFPNGRIPQKEHFIFAVLGITILGYMAAGFFSIFPENQYIEYAFIGFTGAMLINALMPHLILAIMYRKYCPGVFTGCFLVIPFHLIILANFINVHLKITEVIIATLVVGVMLLASIPVFEKLAMKLFTDKGNGLK